MSSKYKFIKSDGIYFVTGTVVGWIDIFTRTIYKEILLDSLRYCQKNQGLCIHAWVLMPNHFHLICSAKDGNLGLVLKNIKSFTAMKLIDSIINNKQESRKDWMLNFFEESGSKIKTNLKYQFWQHENQPILLDNQEMYNQRLNYLHQNPVRAGFVVEPEHWLYSSAYDYSQSGKGLLDLDILE